VSLNVISRTSPSLEGVHRSVGLSWLIVFLLPGVWPTRSLSNMMVVVRLEGTIEVRKGTRPFW
jgi:hypothetical protein